MADCIFYTFVRYIDGHKLPSGTKCCALEYNRKCPCKDKKEAVYSSFSQKKVIKEQL